MVDVASPLGSAWQPGKHGHLSGGAGVTLSEPQPGSIVQCAAWPGQERVLAAAIGKVTGLSLTDAPKSGAVDKNRAAFGVAPGRYLVVAEKEGLAPELVRTITTDIGTVTDLSHGRTAFRISGPKAEWVLAKLFAIDFSPAAFPVASGVASNHHEIFASIQRGGLDQFDLFVFRSFARSFWHTLCKAAEETGYEVG